MRKTVAACSVVLVLSAGLFGASIARDHAGKDTTGPEIFMDNTEIEVSIHDDIDVLLQGVTARDEIDGDVTDSLVVESISNFIDQNRRIVNIAAFDASNNVSKAAREIIYTDYESPRFEATGAFRYNKDSYSLTSNIKAVDCIDGNITSRIRVSYKDEIAAGVAGTYEVTYSVTNAEGEVVSLPVVIELYDSVAETSRPQITLSDYLVYVKKGSDFNPITYIKSLRIGGVSYTKTSDGKFYVSSSSETKEWLEEDQFKIENTVDTAAAGTYSVTYTAAPDSGNAGTARLFVVVTE